MTPDTKRQLQSTGATVAIITAALAGGVYFSSQVLAPPTRITLIWTNGETSPGTTTEVWASTNLTSWTLATNVAGTNSVTLPADKPREFLKIRHRLGNLVSDWARKP